LKDVVAQVPSTVLLDAGKVALSVGAKGGGVVDLLGKNTLLMRMERPMPMAMNNKNKRQMQPYFRILPDERRLAVEYFA
jgi:hypothetical protein